MAEKEIILKSLAFWNDWWFEEIEPESVVREKHLSEILELMDMREAVVLLGIRRSGKSTLMYQLVDRLMKEWSAENICYVNFDDNALVPFRSNVDFLDKVYETYLEYQDPEGKVFLFLDEIQNVANWQHWVKKLYDKNRNIKFVLSGSSASLLKTEYATLLTGRNILHVVYPLSFQEFLMFKNVSTKDLHGYLLRHGPKLKRHLNEYLKYGGFPEVVLTDSDKLKTELLKNYFTGIIARDVLMHHKIRDATKVENLAHFLLTNSSNLISAKKLGNVIKSSTHTVLEYLQILEDVYLIYTVPYFSFTLKEQMLRPRKVYCIDSGLRNAVSFRFSEDIGRIAENTVFLQLKRMGHEVYYWKSEKGREVDFLIKSGIDIIELVQVCWNMDAKVLERETRALKEAMEHFDLKESLIITEDYASIENVGDRAIRFVPLYQWLIEVKNV